HELRHVLPRRVHEHDPDLDAHRHHVLRRLAAADRLLALQPDPAYRVAAHQDLPHRLDVPLVPRHLPALPLRPDHAAGLEGVHSAHARLDSGDRPLDADALEDLAMTPFSFAAPLFRGDSYVFC